MSEYNSPFDAAISHLTNRLNSRGEGSEREELRQSIRVLEAAGKVDKRKAMTWLDGIIHSSDTSPQKAQWLATRWQEINALLESLPDVKE